MVHPAPGNQDKTLVNILKAMEKDLSMLDEERPGIVHRLDKDTSGLMIIAKNNSFHRYIQRLFEDRQVEKTYLGLVEGNLTNNKGMIDAPIGRDENRRAKMAVTSKNSKEAITIFNVRERYTSNDLVEFKLLTGRTHQIRVHAQFIGNPIYNDPTYGTTLDKDNEKFGQYLHAYKLSFKERDGEEVSFEAPLPKVYQNKLDSLTKLNKGE
jgi:23S rRNA pseudouridine1911/1915/1917 synthase